MKQVDKLLSILPEPLVNLLKVQIEERKEWIQNLQHSDVPVELKSKLRKLMFIIKDYEDQKSGDWLQ